MGNKGANPARQLGKKASMLQSAARLVAPGNSVRGPIHYSLLSRLWGLQSKSSSSRSAPAQPELSWDRCGQSWSGPEGASQASRGSWGPSSRKVPASGHRERSGSAPAPRADRRAVSAQLSPHFFAPSLAIFAFTRFLLVFCLSNSFHTKRESCFLFLCLSLFLL